MLEWAADVREPATRFTIDPVRIEIGAGQRGLVCAKTRDLPGCAMNPNTSGRMQRRPFWRDPVFVAVVVALITAAGAIGAAIITAGDDPVSSVSAPSRHVQPSGTIS